MSVEPNIGTLRHGRYPATSSRAAMARHHRSERIGQPLAGIALQTACMVLRAVAGPCWTEYDTRPRD